MRTAAFPIFAFALATVVGCAKGGGAEDAPPPRPVVVEEKPEVVWEVVKIELPGARESSAVAGVAIRQKGDVVTLTESGVFDHTHHVAQLGIDCRYCHAPTAPHSAAGAVAKTCWNCHQNLAVTTPDGVRVTPDNFAKQAVGARQTRRYLLKPDDKVPGLVNLVPCSEKGEPEAPGPRYQATYKDDGDTRVVTLMHPPPVIVPGLPKPERGPTVLLHMKKK
jgi:hypothetical protein